MQEDIKTKRKKWQTPELIVLVRSKPEEAVLSRCSTTATRRNVGCTVTTCGNTARFNGAS